jgi:hypothetical protein
VAPLNPTVFRIEISPPLRLISLMGNLSTHPRLLSSNR